MGMFFLNIFVLIIILSILTFIHEFGHFIVAKKDGVRVLEFSIGFGPVLFKRFCRGTLYQFKLLPFGGFVSTLSDDVKREIKKARKTNPNHQQIAFLETKIKPLKFYEDIENEKTLDGMNSWKKIWFAFAGVFANLIAMILAWAIILGVIGSLNLRLIDDHHGHLRVVQYWFQRSSGFGLIAQSFIFTGKSLLISIKLLGDLLTFGLLHNSIFPTSQLIVGIPTDPLFTFYSILSFLQVLTGLMIVFNLIPVLPLDGGKMVQYLYEGISKKPLNSALERKLITIGWFSIMIYMFAVIFIK